MNICAITLTKYFAIDLAPSSELKALTSENFLIGVWSWIILKYTEESESCFLVRSSGFDICRLGTYGIRKVGGKASVGSIEAFLENFFGVGNSKETLTNLNLKFG